MMKIDHDIQALTESTSNQNNVMDDERDKLLIQPIVC